MNLEKKLSGDRQEIFEAVLSFKDILIDKTEIIKSIGYTPGEEPDFISSLIDDVLSKADEYCYFRCGYRITEVNNDKDNSEGLNFGGVFFNTDKIVKSQLRKSERIAVFLCTIGPGMETWSKKLLKTGDTVMSYIVDITASVIAEKSAEYIHNTVKKHMEEYGEFVTNRYSPGYCNWSVSEQHLIFGLLPKDFCGVSLSESALMKPIKSISGIIGIGKNVRWKNYLCDKCGVKDCTYRTIRKRRNKVSAGKTGR